MLNLLTAFLAGCALVAVLWYYLEVWGEPSYDPETQPPTDFLADPKESVK